MAVFDAIGQFWFLTLEGEPVGIAEQPVTVERPRVNGTAMWKSGIRGKQFTLRSSLDTVNLIYAQATYVLYQKIIGTYVDLLWHGIPWTGPLLKVAVLDVTPVVIRAQLGGVGGMNPPSYGWVKCDWKLQSVYVPLTS